MPGIRDVIVPALGTLAGRVREFTDEVAVAAAPESVHGLRVAVRRLDTALRLVRPASEPPPMRVRSLRWVVGRLGRVRDEDIILDWLADDALGALGIPLDAHLQRVRRGAERRRSRAASRLGDVLAARDFRRTLDRTDEWIASPRLGAPAPALAVAPYLVAPLLSRVVLHRAWHLPWPPAFERETNRTLHRLRRRLKRLRYAMEFLEPAWEGTATAMVGAWRAALDGLGMWNDLALTAGHVASGSGHPAAAEALARRAELALQEWPGWRASWTEPRSLAGTVAVIGGAAHVTALD